MAVQVVEAMLKGVGDGKQWTERGVSALHVRRRLHPAEMQELFRLHPQCPVFTHGRALRAIQEFDGFSPNTHRV